MTQGYGKIGGRRRGSSAWQWVIIGFFPGLLCGGLVVFLLVAGDVMNSFLSTPEPLEITRMVEVRVEVTSIPTDTPVASATPTDAPATATVPVGAAAITVASPTPTPDPEGAAQATEIVITPPGSAAVLESTTNPPLDVPTVAPAQDTSPATQAQTADIPAQLAPIISPMVSVPGGTFQYGTTVLEITNAVEQCLNRDGGNCNPSYGEDSRPQIAVQLDPFQIERTEVSFEQYVAFLNFLSSRGISHTTGCSGAICIQTQNEIEQADITFDGANYQVNPALNAYPVYGVTWFGAQAYCEAVGRRLPSEAEWEYAAKGTAGVTYPWGNQWTPANAMTSRPPVDQAAAPVPVESFPAGASQFSGALNLAGNVEEWVADWYDLNYYNTLNTGGVVLDPQGPFTGTEKVLRGGSFGSVPFFARTVHRRSNAPAPPRPSDTFPRTVGFRCAADLAPSAPVAGSGLDPATLGSTIPADGGTTGNSAAPAVPTSDEAGTDTTSTGDRG